MIPLTTGVKFMSIMGLSRALVTGLALSITTAGAEAAERRAPDAALVERVTEAVIAELRDSGELDRADGGGTSHYVQRQRTEFALRMQRVSHGSMGVMRPVSKGRDHVLGNPDAEVSLIEYSDFECPFCKRFHQIAKQVVQAYGGKVNWVYRHFPLPFHNPAAQREAEAAECAAELGGNDAFWRYADLIYARTPSNGKGVPEGQLPEMAASIALDKAKFAECLRSGRKAERVAEDYVGGLAIGISGTPSNVLRNNRTGATVLRQGALPFEQIKATIDQLLRQK